MRKILKMNSDVNVTHVFNGFLKLSASEKAKLTGLISDFYQKGTTVSIEKLNESVSASVTKMHTGPHAEPCVCCGRG